MAELAAKENQIRTIKKALEEAEAASDIANAAIEELRARLESEKEEHLLSRRQVEGLWDAERRDLQEQIDGLTLKLYEREDFVRKMQREVADFQARVEKNDAEMKRGYESQLHDARQRYSTIELELLDARNELRQIADKSKESAEALTTELKRVSSERSRLGREKEVLHEKVRELERSLDSRRKSELNMQRVTAEKMRALAKETADRMGRVELLEKQLRDMEQNMQSENEKHAKLIAALQREAKQRYDALAANYREEYAQLEEKWMRKISKEKHRAEAYKSKALQCHSRNKALAAAVSEMQADN